MKIVFVGESWNGSSARSLREALTSMPGMVLDDVAEDVHVRASRHFVLKVADRLTRPLQKQQLMAEIKRKVGVFRPDVLLAYKGTNLSAEFIAEMRAAGVVTVNVFPDCSPHSHGMMLKRAMGEYDLVVSTKQYHPPNWHSVYGYRNRCEFVPHGYEPGVHLWPDVPDERGKDLDLVMVATWREQYDRLLRAVAAHFRDRDLKVSIAGNGWARHTAGFPRGWEFPGPIVGRSYCEFARRARIVVAPLHVDNVIDGVRQPGDVDTSRSYQLTAAGCFVLHRRSDYLAQVYDPAGEMPMWDDAAELSRLIAHYLPLDAERRRIAQAAHRRAVPNYSIHARAAKIVGHMEQAVGVAARAPSA